MKITLTTVLLVIALGHAAPSMGWAERGHRLVGELAERQVRPATRQAIAELLEGEREPTLAGVAYWADALRGADPDRFAATSRWHYVKTTTGTCVVDRPRDCPDGACVVGAIETQSRILADTSRSREERRDALKFLVHFVGDVHQPLHAGHREDRGGNTVELVLRTGIEPEAYARAQYRDGVMQTNLHALWDYYVLESAHESVAAHADRLDEPGWPARPSAMTGATAWAAESCRVTDRPGFYPTETNLVEEDLAASRPLAEQRIRQAAFRLAALLDDLLGR